MAGLESRRATAKLGGGERRVESQKKRGKLTARERLGKLFDGGVFSEIDTFNTHRSTDLGLDKQRFEGDSVVTGWGKVEGRTVFGYAQDFTVLGGSLSQIAAQKISKVMDHAIKVVRRWLGSTIRVAPVFKRVSTRLRDMGRYFVEIRWQVG